MTLPEKLDQLSLSTMSRQLETTISEAATKNLSVAATLEWLADRLYLVIESVRPDTKHAPCSNAPAHVDGAGGSRMA